MQLCITVKNNNYLNFHERAILFKQLAVMQKAGLDYHQILSKLCDTKEEKLSQLAQACAKKIKQGEPLDSAALKTGLFSKAESAIIKAALHTGTTDQIFSTLAIQHEKSDRRLRTIKSRLFLPACVLILSGFISPLPSLVSGALGIGQYVLQGFGFALISIFTLRTLLQLPGKLSQSSTGETHSKLDSFDKTILKTPIIGNWYRKKESSKWLGLAGICLESGLPMLNIIPTINGSLFSASIKTAFDESQQLLINGSSVHDALKNNPYLSSEAKNFILTGETSGRLAEMLKHGSTLENQRLQSLEDQIADWIPRVIYFLVMISLASNIISSPITPRID